MAKPQQGLHALYRLTISLVVVVVTFLIYFYFYFQSRHDYFVSRNFRTLNDVGTQLASLLKQFGPLFERSPVNVDTQELKRHEKQRSVQLDRSWLKTLSSPRKNGEETLEEYWRAYRKSENAKNNYNTAKEQLDATLRIIREVR